MTPEQVRIVFYGCEALVSLFGAYGLYEWAMHLIARFKAGRITLDRAQNYFGCAAAVVAFLPFVVTVLFMDTGDTFSLDSANTIFLLFFSLVAGFVLQGCALGAFWYFTKKYK